MTVMRSNGRLSLKRGAWLVPVIGLTACATSTTSSSPNTSSIQRGGTLTVGVNASFTGLDPDLQPNQPSAWVDSLVYSRLVRFTPDLKVVGDLATSWTQPTATSYVFKLRHGVTFQDGGTVTSADVAYSLNRALDPATSDENRAEFADIQSVSTPDAYTVDLTLSKPDAALLLALASYGASVVPKSAVQAHGTLNTTMDGSGPFQFVSETSDTNIVLRRNPHYYVSGEPYLNEIDITAVEDQNSRVNALLTGGEDMIDFVPSQSVSTIKSSGDTVGPGNAGNFYGLMMFEQDSTIQQSGRARGCHVRSGSERHFLGVDHEPGHDLGGWTDSEFQPVRAHYKALSIA